MPAVIEHVNIPDAFLHEPKGVAGASANTMYIADGAGSGSWSQLPLSEVSFTPVTIVNLTNNVTGASDDIVGNLNTATTLTGSMLQIPDGTLAPVPFAVGWSAMQANQIDKNFAEFQNFYNEQIVINEQLRKNCLELATKLNDLLTGLKTLGVAV